MVRERIVAIILRDKKLLLLKGNSPELWSPGGKQEEGETKEQTLRRELQEEIKLKLKSLKPFKTYFLKNPYNAEQMVRSQCFLVEADGEPKPDNEINSFVWFSKEDFHNKTYPMIEENEKIVADLIEQELL
jgi:8-oxo-dGTP diphosphatase